MTPYRLARYMCVTAGVLFMILSSLFLIFLITQLMYGLIMPDPVYPRGVDKEAMEIMADGIMHTFMSLGLGALCGFIFGGYLCRSNNLLLWFIDSDKRQVQVVKDAMNLAKPDSVQATDNARDYSDYAPKT